MYKYVCEIRLRYHVEAHREILKVCALAPACKPLRICTETTCDCTFRLNMEIPTRTTGSTCKPSPLTTMWMTKWRTLLFLSPRQHVTTGCIQVCAAHA